MTAHRPFRASILHGHQLTTGETVEAAPCQYTTDQLRLVLDLQLCQTREEVELLILEPPEKIARLNKRCCALTRGGLL